MNSNSLVRGFFRSGKTSRPVLLSTIFYYASRIDGAAIDELLGEPARLARALIEQHRFFGTDALTVRFDEPLFAAAAGHTVDWSLPAPRITAVAHSNDSEWLSSPQQALASAQPLIDVIARVCAELRNEVAVMAVLPTPRRIMRLAGTTPQDNRSVQVIRDLTDQVCKAGCKIVMLAADEAEGDAGSSTSSIMNTARYFNTFTILDSEAVPEKHSADAIVTEIEHLAAVTGRGYRCVVRVPHACLGDEAACAEFCSAVTMAQSPVALTIDDVGTADRSMDEIASLHRKLAQISFSGASQ